MNSKKYIQVEGNSGLVRDRETGAILNANTTEIQNLRHNVKWIMKHMHKHSKHT